MAVALWPPEPDTIKKSSPSIMLYAHIPITTYGSYTFRILSSKLIVSIYIHELPNKYWLIWQDTLWCCLQEGLYRAYSVHFLASVVYFESRTQPCVMLPETDFISADVRGQVNCLSSRNAICDPRRKLIDSEGWWAESNLIRGLAQSRHRQNVSRLPMRNDPPC